MNKCFINRQKFTFFGDGEQTRDFVYIDDLVQAVWLILQNDTVSGEIFNIGTGKQTSLNQVYNILQKYYNYNIPFEYKEERKGDIKHSYADIIALEKIGYVPNFTMEKGIIEYLNYIKN